MYHTAPTLIYTQHKEQHTMNKPKSERIPILDPLLIVLRSRRMLIALSALVAGVIVTLVPAFEGVHVELLTLLVTLALGLIGGYSVEDAAQAARERATVNADSKEDLYVLIREVLVTLVDEAARQRDDDNRPAAK